jgi:hypothetical protein
MKMNRLLSTRCGQKRYPINLQRTVCSRFAVWLLALALWPAMAPPRLYAREEPLSEEFVDYLGSVESPAVKGSETLDLEEIYRLLKKLVGERNPKDGTTKGKDGEHGDAQKK